jgi:hypothetical protein
MGTSNVAASEVLCGVPKQARIHAFFAEGLDKSRLPSVVKLIPTFLHLSVFLFFAGLCVFLQLEPHSIQCCGFVCRYLRVHVPMHYHYADSSVRHPLPFLTFFFCLVYLDCVLLILFAILWFFQRLGPPGAGLHVYHPESS